MPGGPVAIAVVLLTTTRLARRVVLAAALFVGARPALAQDPRCDQLLHLSRPDPARPLARAACLEEAGWVLAARSEYEAVARGEAEIDPSLRELASREVERLTPTEPMLVVRTGALEEEPDLVRLDGLELPARAFNAPWAVTKGPHVVEAWFFETGQHHTSTIDAESGLYEVELPRLVKTPSSLPDTGEILMGLGGSLGLLSGIFFFAMLGSYADATTEEEAAQFADALGPLGLTFGLTLGVFVTGMVFSLAPVPPTYSTAPLSRPPGVDAPPASSVELVVGAAPRLRVTF